MEEIRGITIRVPERLHRLYRALVALEGITLQEDLVRYIERRVQEALREGRIRAEE